MRALIIQFYFEDCFYFRYSGRWMRVASDTSGVLIKHIFCRNVGAGRKWFVFN